MVSALESRIAASANWLKRYYLLRAAAAGVWVGLAFTLGKADAMAAGALLVAYPLYDAVANWFDARATGRGGGLSPQAVNIIVSLACACAVAIALGRSMNAVLTVFGAWAILAGLLQLVAAMRRWRTVGAQWAMVLSGAQSALAGGIFIFRAKGPTAPTIADFAPYALLGAIYFLISGGWLVVKGARAARG